MSDFIIRATYSFESWWYVDFDPGTTPDWFIHDNRLVMKEMIDGKERVNLYHPNFDGYEGWGPLREPDQVSWGVNDIEWEQDLGE